MCFVVVIASVISLLHSQCGIYKRKFFFYITASSPNAKKMPMTQYSAYNSLDISFITKFMSFFFI